MAGKWATTLDRQHALLSLLTSVNGLVVLTLAALIGFFPGYAVSVIMLFFAYAFVARTRFIYAALRTVVLGGGFFYFAFSYPANLTIDVFIFVAMSVGTLIALRLIEKSRRSVFFQQRVIHRQSEELRQEKDKTEQVLLNVLPARIVARLREGETTIADEYPSVSVLFADVIGFTALAARLSAADVIALLSDLFSSFDDLVAECRLEKIKTIGDAYMAAGGLADPDSDHAVRVVDLGLAMHAEVAGRARRWHELSVRIGVHSGPAAGGVIGKQKFAFDLWGATINMASRLEQHGLPGRVHAGARPLRLRAAR
ncbi:MAG TPA: adenylate/guanylate cyclase domain-containing protein [Candidatus Limnocylindria bacterium]|nr:adenylate/guanylate cyclase domain-containing protein [Candidatus Limnocylindria bacterium]